LDQSCAAQTQGRNRLQRGLNFAQEMTAAGAAPHLRYLVVPDTGHNEKGMLLSREAAGAIFPVGNAER
jgi:hypothetical protein